MDTGIPYTKAQSGALRLYAIGMEAALYPKPLLSAEEVDGIYGRFAGSFLKFALAHIPEGGTLFIPEIPRGGVKVVDRVLATVPEGHAGEETVGQILKGREVNVVRFQLPLSKYDDQGTIGKEPRLPEGFRLPDEVVAGIRDTILELPEDIVDTRDTLNAAVKYLIGLGSEDVYVGPLFMRGEGRNMPYHLIPGTPGHVLDIDDWVDGAGCMDATANMGRNLGPLYSARTHVIDSKMDPEMLANMGKEEAERRALFQGVLAKLKKMEVGGQPALDFIGGLPPMTLEELLRYK
jgi:hypothetical protein